MPSTILNTGQRFPNGTSVDAYPEAQCSQHADAKTLPSDLTSAETAVATTASAATTVTFTTLTTGTPYIAFATVGSVNTFVRFTGT